MQNLIEFLRKNTSWFLFLALVLICSYFIFSGNAYQRSVFFNSSNEISGRLYAITGKIRSYFGLTEENDKLLQQNLELKGEVLALKEQIAKIEADSAQLDTYLENLKIENSDYKLSIARVINSSISLSDNFITIDKGSSQGVKIDMGVVSHSGVVGIVTYTSHNFSIVQPILNTSTKIGCKVAGTNAYGTLVWQGGDPRYANLEDYPKYENFAKGDTIVTSGYSQMFPEGIMAGTIEDFGSQTNDNFYTLKVKLSTDFATLKNVILIDNSKLKEQYELEKLARDAKK